MSKPDAKNFAINFEYLINSSGCLTDDDYGRMIGLSRTIVNRLKNGIRPPTKKQLYLISNKYGIDSIDLFLPKTDFLNLIKGTINSNDSCMKIFDPIAESMPQMDNFFSRYGGQYIVYTSSNDKNYCIASLLKLIRKTKYGIETELINPYIEGGAVQAFEYVGYCYPISTFINIYLQQKSNKYEILNCIYHQSGAPSVYSVRGVWTGIGVKSGKHFVASSTALAIKQSRNINNWRDKVGEAIGYLPIGAAPGIVQRDFTLKSIFV